MLEYLKEEGISPSLLKDLEAYRAQYPTPADLATQMCIRDSYRAFKDAGLIQD